jgi:hypothetical protein
VSDEPQDPQSPWRTFLLTPAGLTALAAVIAAIAALVTALRA